MYIITLSLAYFFNYFSFIFHPEDVFVLGNNSNIYFIVVIKQYIHSLDSFLYFYIFNVNIFFG